MKPGLRLALHLLAEELEDLEDWLRDRYDVSADIDSVEKNDEARHFDTVARVRNELYRIGREAESLTLVPQDPARDEAGK